jgi:hypothetical protein
MASLWTSFVSLSLRKPRNTGCRMWPSRVHSVNSMLATSFGETQVAGLFASTEPAKGEVLRCNGFMVAANSLSMRASKPEPVWPTYFSFPLSSTPSNSDPKCLRLLRGAVYPPMMASCEWWFLIFNQDLLRTPFW